MARADHPSVRRSRGPVRKREQQQQRLLSNSMRIFVVPKDDEEAEAGGDNKSLKAFEKFLSLLQPPTPTHLCVGRYSGDERYSKNPQPAIAQLL